MKYILLSVFTLISMSVQAASSFYSIDTTEVENKNISYRLTSDHNYVYINLRTKDRSTMMAMVRAGVSVYFDIKGKKKKNVYVKYPINSRKGERKDRGQSDQKRPEFSEIINDLPKKAEYSYFKNTQQFHSELNTQDIRLGFEFNQKERLLVYNLKIPKEEITDNKKLDMSKLSIGVVIGGEKSQRGNFQAQGGPSGGSQRGSRGGGRGGGSGVGRGQGGGNNSQQRERPSETTINFWFDAIIKE